MLTGRMWAELATVAWNDACAVGGDPYAWPPPPPMTTEQRREGERLRVLADRFAYRARALGFVKQGTDYIFGRLEQQAFKTCKCGLRYETARDWEALPLCGRQTCEDAAGVFYVLELRNCPCRTTLAIEKPTT